MSMAWCLEVEDDAYIDCYEEQLGNEHASVPAVGHHLVEINLAKGDEQRDEHHHGEYRVHDRPQPVTQIIELGHVIECQVGDGAHGNRYGQCPVFQEPYEGGITDEHILCETY